MKPFVAIFLLLCLLFDLAGVMVLFKIQQSQIRREIKRQIKLGVPEDELHVISMPVSGSPTVTWKNDHEFMYLGHMYDIVRKESKNDSLVYYCINDVEEKELFADLNQLLERKSDQSNPGQTAALKLFHILSLIYLIEDCIPDNIDISIAGFLPHCFNYYSSPAIQHNYPPPRFLSFIV